MNRYELIGNVTTVIKTVSMMLAGYLLAFCMSQGLNLPITEAQLSEIIMTLIFFIAAYLDAKFPNAFKFLHKTPDGEIETEADLINEEYENYEAED